MLGKSDHWPRLLVAIAAVVVTASVQADKESAELGPLPALKTDQAKAELGKRLFFDPRLSGDAAISCAHCHEPENGFAHSDALSPGYPGNEHFRNSPTLINVAHKKVWMHDGRLGTNLNDVTREMLTETYIMNMDMRLMQERAKQDPVYVKMFKDAGYGEPSNGSIRKAIPEFLKTLVSKNVPFDSGKMSDAAKRGLALFKGKGNCVACHNGPMFSDGKPHNTGVPENLDVWLDPMRHQAFLTYNKFMGTPNYMNLKRDLGAHVRNRSVYTGEQLKGAFITPTLRELKYTAPYMHNGMLKTLEDVVAFYNEGGGEDSRKDPLLKPLILSKEEQADLVEFLNALSGDPLTGKEFVWSEPYPEEYPVIADWRKARN